ncbi:HbrB-domain-containing protein [Gyrodon lividus]|nr:HbrB-domain-containing protein [Gyrodon lividus]
MLLGLARRSYDIGRSSPQHPNVVVDDANDDRGDLDGTAGGPDRLGRSDHRRSVSSNDATPRPRIVFLHTGPFLGLPGFHHHHHRRPQNETSPDTNADNNADFDVGAPLGHQDPNSNILSSDPFLSSHPQQQQPFKRLGFFSSNTTNHSKTLSPSRAQHHTNFDVNKERLHSDCRSETTSHKDTSNTNMASVASSSAVSKGHTSPSKPSTRTYDAKLVTREMHRLGTLGLSPALTPSLSSSASASTLTLAPAASPSTATIGPNASHSHSHGISALTSVAVSDKDNPWGTLHVHVLPLFNEEPLRVPIEDLNALVRRHIQTVLAASPPRALTTLAADARELIGAGMVTINAKLTGLSDELLMSRLVELWSFFWDHVLPYVEGVLLPLQTDQLLTSLHRTAKQHRSSSPTRQGPKIAPTLPTSLAAFSRTIDVRSVALCAFRDRVVLPLHGRLHTLLSPPQSKDMLARLSQYRQPRLQQMLLVLTSERRVRPPSPTLSLRVPEVQPNAGEAAIADLLRLLSQAQQHARAHHTPRQPLARGLTVRAATPSFLSAGIPRDRRGRIGGHDVKRMILSAGGWPVSVPAGRRRSAPSDDVDTDVEDEGEVEGAETPRLGTMDTRGRREVLSLLRAPLEHQHRASTGGWGLGAGNEEKQREDDDDDDEGTNWDQAQATVERMVGMKPSESPAEMRRRVT